MELPRPTPNYIRKRLLDWEKTDALGTAEKTVGLVFQTWPGNTEYSEVLAKVIVLNRIYSTNIYDPYTVTQHILSARIDERLKAGDITLVLDLANVRFRTRSMILLSFASKYCGWHEPDHFQIFDSYVEWLLWLYVKQFKFASVRRYSLREYATFVATVDQCRSHFALEGFTRKEIDKFLWFEATELWRSQSKAKVPE